MFYSTEDVVTCDPSSKGVIHGKGVIWYTVEEHIELEGLALVTLKTKCVNLK